MAPPRKRQKPTKSSKAERQAEAVRSDVVEYAGEIEGSDNDDAPLELPVDKCGSNFIPLQSGKKKKGKKKVDSTAHDNVSIGAEEEIKETVVAPCIPKRTKKFIQKAPGYYSGTKKNAKFRIVDLSANANNPSASHKRAIDLKQRMFNRHRRVTGVQYVGMLHKSKMVGKR